MQYLKDKRCYLAAPIENDTLNGHWRANVHNVLVDDFKINLFDPFMDAKQQWKPVLDEAKKNKDFPTIVRIAKNFVRKDLSLVDHSDFVIAFVPYKVHTTGVCHEIINSNNAKKPTLLVTDSEDITCIPAWYFGFIPLEFMFNGWNALFAYLQEVDEGKHKDNNRWNYVYGLI